MEFWVTLIKAPKRLQTKEALEVLNDNCTYVVYGYWIYEGDIEYLEEKRVEFEVIEEGAVGALGGLSQKKLIQVCEDAFGVDLRDTKWH